MESAQRALGEDRFGIYICACGQKNRVDMVKTTFAAAMCGRCKREIPRPRAEQEAKP
jgi:hypothetical protein